MTRNIISIIVLSVNICSLAWIRKHEICTLFQSRGIDNVYSAEVTLQKACKRLDILLLVLERILWLGIAKGDQFSCIHFYADQRARSAVEFWLLGKKMDARIGKLNIDRSCTEFHDMAGMYLFESCLHVKWCLMRVWWTWSGFYFLGSFLAAVSETMCTSWSISGGIGKYTDKERSANALVVKICH